MNNKNNQNNQNNQDENISDFVNSKLLPYQIPHKLQMLEAINIRKRVLDASDTGTGKTYVAIALCKELGLEPFIICPKPVIPVWDGVCKFYNVNYFGISNYEMLKNCRYYTKDYLPTKCPYMDKIIDGIVDEGDKKTNKADKADKIDRAVKSDKPNDKNKNIINARLKKFGLKNVIDSKSDLKKFDKLNISDNSFDSSDSDSNSESDNLSEFGDVIDKLKKVKKNKKKKCNVSFVFYLPSNVMIIFDEAHRCKNTSSMTSKLLEGFNQCENKIMILSATITDKIKCFAPFGMFFGFYQSTKQFKMWIKKEIIYERIRNSSKKLNNSSNSSNSSNQSNSNSSDTIIAEACELKIIHNKIFPQYGSRMKVKELIEAKLFPETQIQADCYYLENHIEIDKLFHEINTAVLNYSVKELYAEQLARLIYCRQRMEMLKMPIFFDLIEEGLSNGHSIVTFVNYVESLNYICYHMKNTLKSKYNSEISVIVGGQSIKEREENLNNFQSNKTRLIVIMIQAGGVGLSCHDVHKTHPRIAIISPTWSGDQMKQVLGRVHRSGGTSSIQKIVYVAKTYEEKICALIKDKLSVIDGINDGDLMGSKIDKKVLELENMAKLNEVEQIEKIKQYIKGEEIDSIGINDNSTIEERLVKIPKKKAKNSNKDTKNTF